MRNICVLYLKEKSNCHFFKTETITYLLFCLFLYFHIFVCLHLINYFSICFHTFLQETVGSRITKEASDIVLKNASFADIVRTILCSRNIQDTLRKLLQLQLAMIAVTFFTVFIGICVLGVSLLRLL